MDEKASRRIKSQRYARRHRQIMHRGREIWQSIQQHRSALWTWTLALILVALLFGIASQLPAPASDVTPTNVQVIDYTTFVEQIQAHNVQTVAFRGNEVNALLKTALKPAAIPASTTSQPASNEEIALWNRALNNDTLTITASDTTGYFAGRSVFLRIPDDGSQYLLSRLTDNNVPVSVLPTSPTASWLPLVLRFLPMLVLLIMLFFAFRPQSQRNPLNAINERMGQIGKSKARRFEHAQEVLTPADQKKSATSAASQVVQKSIARVATTPQVTFADVAGIDEVRAELEELVQFLRAPDQYNRLGARMPRGALLVGSPGTGKTLLAKAVAGEAHVPFFSMSASEFVEMFVGVGASRVRDLFAQARQVAPCVIFIDEIDAVGRKRSMRMNGGNDERDQTLNQLLVELDGFASEQGIVVLAATNRVDILDKALLRPGRFDRHIMVSAPDRVGREAILRVHTREVPLHEDVVLERLARMTTGMTGADLANLVNEAALSAARRGYEQVDHGCFEDALARVQLGALRPIVMSESERRVIAVHEGGHALVAYHLPEADTVNRVTILPRGQSLGVTQFTPEQDRYNYSREVLLARIAVALGGRVAEELTFGPAHVTTGAENDLQVVTGIARKMVTRWGMSDKLGVVFADYQPEEGYALNLRRLDPDSLPTQSRTLVADASGRLTPNGQFTPPVHLAMALPAPRQAHAPMTGALIDAEVQHIIRQGQAMARAILLAHADQLSLLTDKLLEHEQLDRNQFEALF